MSRGVIYIVWGNNIDVPLNRSIASLRQHHPELPHEVIRLPKDLDPTEGLLEKSRMMKLTPYDETLFLDADTVVLGRLDFAFQKAVQFGLACAICECPWARRYHGLQRDDGVEYNTGVLFFTRKAEEVFKNWEKFAKIVDSASEYVDGTGKIGTMAHNDQAAFAKAVDEWERAPFILPLNWNFRPSWHATWFGPIKIWHGYLDPPPVLHQLNASYSDLNAPIRFHSVLR